MLTLTVNFVGEVLRVALLLTFGVAAIGALLMPFAMLYLVFFG